MSTPTTPFRPVGSAAALRLLRCARHPEREAAAKCPACGLACCRECVNEHEGRLLCADCLAKTVAAAARAQPPRDLAPVRRALVTAAAFVALWVAFHLVATAVARIPAEFHDATIWAKP